MAQSEVRRLIRRTAAENLTWSEERIADELRLELQIRLSSLKRSWLPLTFHVTIVEFLKQLRSKFERGGPLPTKVSITRLEI